MKTALLADLAASVCCSRQQPFLDLLAASCAAFRRAILASQGNSVVFLSFRSRLTAVVLFCDRLACWHAVFPTHRFGVVGMLYSIPTLGPFPSTVGSSHVLRFGAPTPAPQAAYCAGSQCFTSFRLMRFVGIARRPPCPLAPFSFSVIDSSMNALHSDALTQASQVVSANVLHHFPPPSNVSSFVTLLCDAIASASQEDDNVSCTVCFPRSQRKALPFFPCDCGIARLLPLSCHAGLQPPFRVACFWFDRRQRRSVE